MPFILWWNNGEQPPMRVSFKASHSWGFIASAIIEEAIYGQLDTAETQE